MSLKSFRFTAVIPRVIPFDFKNSKKKVSVGEGQHFPWLLFGISSAKTLANLLWISGPLLRPLRISPWLSEHKIRGSNLDSFYPRLFKNLAQPSMMAGLDSISTKMYFNPPTFAAAKKSFQSTMPAPMTTSFLWLSGA